MHSRIKRLINPVAAKRDSRLAESPPYSVFEPASSNWAKHYYSDENMLASGTELDCAPATTRPLIKNSKLVLLPQDRPPSAAAGEEKSNPCVLPSLVMSAITAPVVLADHTASVEPDELTDSTEVFEVSKIATPVAGSFEPPLPARFPQLMAASATKPIEQEALEELPKQSEELRVLAANLLEPPPEESSTAAKDLSAHTTPRLSNGRSLRLAPIVLSGHSFGIASRSARDPSPPAGPSLSAAPIRVIPGLPFTASVDDYDDARGSLLLTDVSDDSTSTLLPAERSGRFKLDRLDTIVRASIQPTTSASRFAASRSIFGFRSDCSIGIGLSPARSEISGDSVTLSFRGSRP